MPALPLDEPASAAHSHRSVLRRSVLLGLLGVVAIAALLGAHARIGHSRSELHVSPASGTSFCPQADVLAPASNATLDDRRQHMLTPDYRAHAIGILSRVVQTRAESFDDEAPVGQDDRWKAFDGLHERLRLEFPRIHAAGSPIELQKINTYGASSCRPCTR